MDIKNIMDARLYRVIVEGNCASLKELTSNNLDIVRGITPQGNSALHVAASRGHHEMVGLLINLKPCILSVKNIKDETALHKAAAGGHLQVVDLLLNINHQLQCNCGAHVGGDLEACDSTIVCDVELFWRSVNKNNETALHYAARGGYVPVVEALFRKVQGMETIINKRGESALYTACDHARHGVAKFLNDLPSVGDSRADGRTCLHVAIDTKQADLAVELLNKRRGLALKADKSGNMPLHLAILHGSLHSVQEILRIAPETSFHINADKMAPIHIAAKVGSVESIRLLIESAPHCIEMLGDHNKSALHFALENGKNWQVEEYLLQNAPDAAFLVNELDEDDNTPLHMALTFNNIKAVEKMVQISTWNVKAVNREGITELLGEMETCSVSRNGFNLPEKGKAMENNQEKKSTEITLSEEKAETCRMEGSPPTQSKELRFSEVTANIEREGQKMESGAVSENGTNLAQNVNGIKSKRGNDTEDYSHKESVQTLSIVATLIATVTFAAAFTIPGGVSSDKGIPILMHSAALKAFVISNTLGMCFSMSALILLFNVSSTFLFLHATSSLVPLNVASTFYYASGLIYHAFMATMVSYSTGLYVLVAPRCLWLAVIACTAGCAVPFMGTLWRIVIRFRLTRRLLQGDRRAVLRNLLRRHQNSRLVGLVMRYCIIDINLDASVGRLLHRNRPRPALSSA